MNLTVRFGPTSTTAVMFGICLVLATCHGAVTDTELTHRVGAGKITGLMRTGSFDGSDRTWYEFRRIRYTEKLERFDYPRYLDPYQWEGVYDGTKYGNICPQNSGNSGDEDCLFLNIFVPDNLDRDKNIPVMVWIHGGAFVSGSGPGNDVSANQAHYTDGRGLALTENVIVVNLNYRLGTLGFLSFIDSEHRGNFGVRDMQMAIKWIHQNIIDFGGDPGRITLFGCSAGGRAVGSQVMTPYNDGLIFGGVGQSGDGSSDLIWDAHAEENRQAVFETTGCTDESTRLSCLRSKSVKELLSAANSVSSAYREWQWGIVLDNDFYVDRCGYSDKTNGGNDACYKRHAQVHWMSGCCSADGYGFAPSWIKTPGQATREKVEKAIADMTLEYGYRNESYQSVLYAYTDWKMPLDDYRMRNLTVEAETDWRYCFPTVNTHQERSKIAGAKESFLYLFDKKSDLQGGMEGANHCTDNSFEFGWPVVNKWHGAEEEVLSRQMMSYWANFARTGSPNSAQTETAWQAFDAAKRNFLRFDLNLVENLDYMRDEKTAAWLDLVQSIEDIE